jgi:hypothetical protein
MFKSAGVGHELIEDVLAVVAERTVSQIVRQADCFGETLV